MKVEAGKDSQPQQMTTYISRVTGVGNVLIALSALSYVFGFIVVNTYLATKYKIYNFEILNSRYIYSGAVFLLLCLLAFLGASMLSRRIDAIHDKSVLQKTFEFIFWLGAVHGLSTAIFNSLLLVALNRNPASFFGSLPSEIPVALWLDIAIVAFYFQIRLYKNKSWENLPHEMPFPNSAFTIIIILILTLIYGAQFYFFLPPSVGGGLPIPVTLVVDKNKIETAQNLLPISLQNPSASVYLIEQNSDSLYVLVGNQFNSAVNSSLLPIQIDKALIVGIIYPDEIKTSSFLDSNKITFPPTPTMTPIITSTP